MKALLACVAVLLFAGQPAAEEQPKPTIGQFCSWSPVSCGRMLEAAWRETCAYSVYVCDGLPAPRVLFMPFVDGLYGLYMDGMGIIYINRRMPADWYVDSTIAHEMTHYLQDVTNADLSRCEREAEAFAIKNLVLKHHGRPDLRRLDWREPYGC